MSENLTVRQRKAIGALLMNYDITQAAKAAGVSRETLYRWKGEEPFRAALNDASRQALEGLSNSLIALSALAVDGLNEVLSNPTTPPAVKIRAADIVLTRILQLCELVELENRVAELEKHITDTPGRF
jgi:hypothetical protein